MNAKRFFYVSAGILLLVIAYSAGARRANAQGNAYIVDFLDDCALDSMGRIYRGGGGVGATWTYYNQVPGPGTPVALGRGGCDPTVAMSDGRVFRWSSNASCVPGNGHWESWGNIFGTVADATDPSGPARESWSGAKGVYRK